MTLGGSEPREARHPFQKHGTRAVERRITCRRLNTAMHHNLQAFANLLLASFYTIRFRRLGPEWDWQEPLSDSDHRRVEEGMRIDRLIFDVHRHRIRRTLWAAGHIRFLDAVEGYPVGEWRLHLFLADPEAFPVVDHADGVLGAGEPVHLNQQRSSSGAWRRSPEQIGLPAAIPGVITVFP